MSDFDKLHKQSFLSKEEILELYAKYNGGLLEATPKEKLIINPKVAYHIKPEYIQKSIPEQLLKSYKSVYGEVSNLSYIDPVSNLIWDYLYFVNSDYFRPAALAFERSERAVLGTKIKPSYTKHIAGTKSYENFWEEEFKRIVHGYEPIVDGKPCGIRISGEFYFYLNYCRIVKIKKDANGKTVNLESFPDFLAMDYYWFRELESRENPALFNLDDSWKRSLSLLKSRRKGFSYKAASGCVWIAAFNKKARVGIASEPNSSDATDAVKCAKKCIPIIDHLSVYTPFGRKDPGDPKVNGGWVHSKAKITNKYFEFTFGLENTKNRSQKGRMSTIFTMSLSKDDAASGEGLNRLYFEESGKVGNLDKAWIFARESMKAGSLFRGIAVLFGCLTENNKVWTPEGSLVSIKDIKEGDELLGYNKLDYSIEKAVYVKSPEEKECVRITTDNNSVIECSIDHPILWSHKNYKYIDRITDRTTERKKRIYKGSFKKVSFNEAQFIKEGEQIAVLDTLDVFGNSVLQNARSKGLTIDTNSEYIHDLHKYDKETFCELIGGLYDANGSVVINNQDSIDKNNIDIKNTKNKNNNNIGSIILHLNNNELLYDIKLHMVKIGVHGFVRESMEQKIDNKATDKASILNKQYEYVINDSKSIVRFKNNIIFSAKGLQHKLNILSSSVTVKDDTRAYMSFRHTGSRRNDLIEMHNIRFETVDKIERIGAKPIYNLTANSTHTYIANNIITHNTGGEMKTNTGKEGSSKAFSVLFNNPVAAELAHYDNIYEYKKSNKPCGLFISDMWSNFGASIRVGGKEYIALDNNGNAYFWVAELALNKERLEKMPPNGKQKDYNDFLTQRCKTPSEAFLVTSSNVFNSSEIIARINSIKMEKGGFSKYRTPGELVMTEANRVVFKAEASLQPITDSGYGRNDREGCLLVYEHPLKVNGVIPEGAYFISVDPIAMNNSGGTSLNAVIVIKTPKYSQYMGPEKIVATYFGRTSTRPLDYLHNLLMKLSIYYNAQISHETDRDGGILSYFTHKNELRRLMPSPMLVTKKYLPTSKTLLREFGHSMANERLKSIGEGYLNEWLEFTHPTRRLVDENSGNIVEKQGLRNLDMIYDELILNELVNYSRSGNFDSTMALMGAMIQLSDKFNTSGDILINNEYYNSVDKDMIDYMKSVVKDYM